MTAISFGTDLDIRPDDAERIVREALAAEGFGVLTEIEVQQTLKTKLGVEMTPYKILGACNPPLAHRAISADPEVGALLPCNVVIRSSGERTRVEMMDPLAMMDLIANADVHAVAEDAAARLHRAMTAIKQAAAGVA